MRIFRGQPQRSVSLEDVQDDSTAQVALNAIDQRVGLRRNDGVLTERQLLRGAELFHEKARRFEDLSERERQSVEAAIPTLWCRLQLHEPDNDVPFATAIAPKAIVDPALRKCAQNLAECFGTGSADLNLTELRAAQEALKSGELPANVDKSVVTPDNLAEIELFMLTGKTDLVIHRGLVINGRKFDEAFPLSIEPTPEAIKEVDQRVASCGYDRIYVKGSDDQVYLVLAKSSSLKVEAGMRAQMGEGPDNFRDGNEVIGSVDVSNTLGEATIGFWGDTVSNTMNSIRGGFGKQLSTTIDETGTMTTGAMASGASASSAGAQGKTVLVAGTVLAAGVGTSAAVVGLQAVAPIIAVIVAGLTTFNVVEWARNERRLDLSPVYNAIGVTLNRPDRIR